jgi:hypothetical protein
MKSNSNEKPEIFQNLGDGSRHYNFNIKEVSVKNENGESTTAFEYDTVHFWNSPEYEYLVSEVIKTRYSTNGEIALLRQKDVKGWEFKEYSDFCENAKTMVKKDMDSYENIRK